MTWTMCGYSQIQMKSNVHDTHGGNLYGVHHPHMPTHWKGEEVFPGPKKIQVGFWYSCLEDRGN